MTVTATRPPRMVATADARSNLYGLLAQAVAFPDAARRQELQDLAERLAPLPDGLDADARALAAALPASEEHLAAFAGTFTHSTSRDCPVYETAFTTSDIYRQTEELADIAGFYRAFGVEPVTGGDRTDHIGAELEFMQLLTANEYYAHAAGDRANVRLCRHAERAFLRDHLGGWGQVFAGRLADTEDAWYSAAGRLLGRWLEQECRGLRVQPPAPNGEPAPAPRPDEEEDGPGDEIDWGAAPGSPMPLPLLER